MREACAAVRAGGKRLVVATPRILKPGEEALLHFYLRLQADALLLRGAGSLQQLLDLGGPGRQGQGGARVGCALSAIWPLVAAR